MFGDYPWQVIGWLTLGLVIAWLLMVMPSLSVAIRFHDSILERERKFVSGLRFQRNFRYEGGLYRFKDELRLARLSQFSG
jgi:hypothetical protein